MGMCFRDIIKRCPAYRFRSGLACKPPQEHDSLTPGTSVIDSEKIRPCIPIGNSSLHRPVYRIVIRMGLVRHVIKSVDEALDQIKIPDG